jgi:hypothetical protein
VDVGADQAVEGRKEGKAQLWKMGSLGRSHRMWKSEKDREGLDFYSCEDSLRSCRVLVSLGFRKILQGGG